MYRDAPMATFTKNDGMISLQHCQEWSFCYSLSGITSSYHFLYMRTFIKKYQCESQIKCVGYTFEQSRFKCILHSSLTKGLTPRARGKQTGTKKTDYILSLPEISLCSDQNRRKRCKREPKCRDVDCIRNT